MAKIFVFVIAFFCFFGCQNNQIGAKLNEISPEISAQNLDGKNVSLNDFDADLKIIVFWQYGCLGCVQILPNLENFIKTSGKKIAVFAINSMNDKATVQKFYDKVKPKHIEILLDNVQISFERFELKRIPTTIILDKNNKILQILAGEIPWDIVKSRILSYL